MGTLLKTHAEPAAYLVTLAHGEELCQPDWISGVVTSVQLLGIPMFQLAGQLKTTHSF